MLAVRHPGLLRTIVLDSAYPVLGDNSNSEVNHGQAAMDIVCARSSSCRGLGGSADARFAVLLGALRAHPVSGVAPGASGEPPAAGVKPGAPVPTGAKFPSAPVAQTVGVRWRHITTSPSRGKESGLRGGFGDVNRAGYDVDLHGERWACNLTVSGRVRGNQLIGEIAGDLRFATSDGHGGRLSIA